MTYSCVEQNCTQKNPHACIVCAKSGRPWLLVNKLGAREVDLSRSVQFSPSGETKVSNGVQGNIVFATFATEGQMKDVRDSLTANGPDRVVQFAIDSN